MMPGKVAVERDADQPHDPPGEYRRVIAENTSSVALHAQSRGGKRLTPRLLAALVVGLAAIPSIGAAQEQDRQEQGKQPAPPGFDYWQPEWMTRELWGPGHMPKSMMARLLRQTTYVNFGVEKEYEGAQSPLTGKPEAIADGPSFTRRIAPRVTGRTAWGTAIWVKPFRLPPLCLPTDPPADPCR